MTSHNGRGGRRHAHHAFTEQDVAMLPSILKSLRTNAINIEIMCAVVRMRELLAFKHANRLGTRTRPR